jgi:NADH-quinone oxidoreductase subunit J
MLALSDYIFYFLAFIAFFSACGVILVQNPIYSALFLAFAMIAVSAIFVTLDAVFIAGVQLIVYAGAVMVLFVMVLMLFDLKHEFDAFSKGVIGGVLKLASVGVILGLVMGSVYMSASMVFNNPLAPLPAGVDQVKMLSLTLFGNYIFAFEVIGALLLVIAIGAVTLSRIRGGTHAND